MTWLPQDHRCQATTRTGDNCYHAATGLTRYGARLLYLCGQHRRQAREGRLVPWDGPAQRQR